MMHKAAQTRIERHEELDAETKLEMAIEILVKKFDISQRDAKGKIAFLAKAKNLDTEKTCEVLIRLENIINETWFDSSSKR